MWESHTLSICTVVLKRDILPEKRLQEGSCVQREREKETKHPEIVRPQTALHRTALRLRGLGEKKKKKIERREMDLLKAIKNGNAEEVRSIIEKKGASIVSQTSKKGEIPLLEAGFSLLFFLFFFFFMFAISN
jgi:hypothetical protein